MNEGCFQHCSTPRLCGCKQNDHALPPFPVPGVAVLAIFPSNDGVASEPHLEDARVIGLKQGLHHTATVLQNIAGCCWFQRQPKGNLVMLVYLIHQRADVWVNHRCIDVASPCNWPVSPARKFLLGVVRNRFVLPLDMPGKWVFSDLGCMLSFQRAGFLCGALDFKRCCKQSVFRIVSTCATPLNTHV